MKSFTSHLRAKIAVFRQEKKDKLWGFIFPFLTRLNIKIQKSEHSFVRNRLWDSYSYERRDYISFFVTVVILD